MKKCMGSLQRVLNTCDMDIDAGEFVRNLLLTGIILGAILSASLDFLGYPFIINLAGGFALFAVFSGGYYMSLVLKRNRKIEQIEAVIPDFLSLMSSNLRSGLTPDRAFVLSVRDEFGPLEKEVELAAKEIVSGTSFTDAFTNMTERIDSETFAKAVRLMIEGVHSGGNLADLLENTSLDIRRFTATRKEITATIRVYELFIIAAASIGAPLLYAVANFLINVVFMMKEKIHISTEATATVTTYLPLFGTGMDGLSPESVYLFSIAAITMTTFFGALTAGTVSKGEESAGFVYIPAMVVIAFMIFLGVGVLLSSFLGGVFLF